MSQTIDQVALEEDSADEARDMRVPRAPARTAGATREEQSNNEPLHALIDGLPVLSGADRDALIAGALVQVEAQQTALYVIDASTGVPTFQTLESTAALIDPLEFAMPWFMAFLAPLMCEDVFPSRFSMRARMPPGSEPYMRLWLDEVHRRDSRIWKYAYLYLLRNMPHLPRVKVAPNWRAQYTSFFGSFVNQYPDATGQITAVFPPFHVAGPHGLAMVVNFVERTVDMPRRPLRRLLRRISSRALIVRVSGTWNSVARVRLDDDDNTLTWATLETTPPQPFGANTLSLTCTDTSVLRVRLGTAVASALAPPPGVHTPMRLVVFTIPHVADGRPAMQVMAVEDDALIRELYAPTEDTASAADRVLVVRARVRITAYERTSARSQLIATDTHVLSANETLEAGAISVAFISGSVLAPTLFAVNVRQDGLAYTIDDMTNMVGPPSYAGYATTNALWATNLGRLEALQPAGSPTPRLLDDEDEDAPAPAAPRLSTAVRRVYPAAYVMPALPDNGAAVVQLQLLDLVPDPDGMEERLRVGVQIGVDARRQMRDAGVDTVRLELHTEYEETFAGAAAPDTVFATAPPVVRAARIAPDSAHTVPLAFDPLVEERPQWLTSRRTPF